MKEYIEREAVMQDFADYVKWCNNSDFAQTPTWNEAVQIVEDAPAADVVEVVQCKDCKWRPRNMGMVKYVEHLRFPWDDTGREVCPYAAGDPWYNEEPNPNGYCHLGEREVEL